MHMTKMSSECTVTLELYRTSKQKLRIYTQEVYIHVYVHAYIYSIRRYATHELTNKSSSIGVGVLTVPMHAHIIQF